MADPALRLDPGAVRKLELYRDRLATASRQFNLTTVREPDAIEVRHLVECVALGRLLEQRGLMGAGVRILDIGSGAGLPGIPLQIAFPAAAVTLLESLTKRCLFLEAMIDELELENATVLDGRAEEFGRDPHYREAFDLVVARAVAPLPVLLEYAMPFLRVGGHLAATKGSATLRELEESGPALRELNAEHIETVPFEPPGGLAQSVIIVRKTGPIAARYPRRPGMASKRPLT